MFLQDGALKKSIDGTAAGCEDVLRTKQAWVKICYACDAYITIICTLRAVQVLEAICRATNNDVAEVANALRQPGQVLPEQIEDITSSFIGTRVLFGPLLPKSDISIYKGLLAKLHDCSRTLRDQVAVLAGKDKVVCDVILTPGLAAVQASKSCVERWEEKSYKMLGAVFFRSSRTPQEHISDDLCRTHLAKDCQLLILYREEGTPSCYQVQLPEGACGSEMDVHLVDVRSVAENRKKDCAAEREFLHKRL